MSLIHLLCDALYVDESEIIKFASTSPHRYKIYKIPKRSSKGSRTIAHPSKELKFIQRLLVSYIKDSFPVHESSYAYKVGTGIKDNAKVHSNTKYLLKMDFENFFPSIKPEIFFSTSEKLGLIYSEKDMMLLKNILFFKDKRTSPLRLSIGAPSSPFVSNAIMYFFDKEIRNACEEIGIIYTRYADDLTFSTNNKNTLFDIPGLVVRILNNNFHGEIKVNERKTVFTSKAHNRHVTGVTLTNDNKLSVGRNKKRLISSMVHRFVKNLLEEEDILRLQGLISFATYIEPMFYQRMCRKYGEDNLIKLKRFNKGG